MKRIAMAMLAWRWTHLLLALIASESSVDATDDDDQVLLSTRIVHKSIVKDHRNADDIFVDDDVTGESEVGETQVASGNLTSREFWEDVGAWVSDAEETISAGATYVMAGIVTTNDNRIEDAPGMKRLTYENIRNEDPSWASKIHDELKKDNVKIDVGPVSIDMEGSIDIEPQFKFGISGDSFEVSGGLDKIDETGIHFGVTKEVKVILQAKGRSFTEMLANLKTKNQGNKASEALENILCTKSQGQGSACVFNVVSEIFTVFKFDIKALGMYCTATITFAAGSSTKIGFASPAVHLLNEAEHDGFIMVGARGTKLQGMGLFFGWNPKYHRARLIFMAGPVTIDAVFSDASKAGDMKEIMPESGSCNQSDITIRGYGGNLYGGCRQQTIEGGICDSGHFCRNPDNEPAIWCYQKHATGSTNNRRRNSRRRWAFCEDCHEEMIDTADGKGAGYRGCQTRTREGSLCLPWTQANSNAVRRRFGLDAAKSWHKGLGEHNYCRNPDGESGGIWCYIDYKNGDDQGEGRWAYCDPLSKGTRFRGNPLPKRYTLVGAGYCRTNAGNGWPPYAYHSTREGISKADCRKACSDAKDCHGFRHSPHGGSSCHIYIHYDQPLKSGFTFSGERPASSGAITHATTSGGGSQAKCYRLNIA